MAANPYALDGTQKANAATLNAITGDIAIRLAKVEGMQPAIEAATISLVDVGLRKINEQLLPVIVQEQARVERGVLLANSSTPIALVLNAVVDIIVGQDDWLSFSPSAFVALTRQSNTRDYATLETISWDRSVGLYRGTIVAVAGYPGPWADWQLGSQAGATLAQQAYLVEGKTARDTTVASAAQVATDRQAVEAINDRFTVSASPPTGGTDGDIWFMI